MDKSKVKDLIAQLEKHQQEQIKCLQAWLDLASEDESKAEPNSQKISNVSMHKKADPLNYWSNPPDVRS